MDRNRRILVVDDQAELRDLLSKLLLRSNGPNETVSLVRQMRERLLGGGSGNDDGIGGIELPYQIDTAGQGEEAFEMIKAANGRGEPYAVVFMDMRMPPGWDGMEAAKNIRRIDKKVEIVIMTAYADHDQATIAETVGSPEKLLYLKKPFHSEEIAQLALSLTSKWDLERQRDERQAWLESVIRAIGKMKVAGSERDIGKNTIEALMAYAGSGSGFIVSQNDGEWVVKAASRTDDAAAAEFIRRHSDGLCDILAPRHLDGHYLLPLRRDGYTAVAVLRGVAVHGDPEWHKLLNLLMMTAVEVLAADK